MNIQPGDLCTAHLAARDETRVKKAAAKEAEAVKSRRKTRRVAEKHAEEARIAEEGVTYEAGGAL